MTKETDGLLYFVAIALAAFVLAACVRSAHAQSPTLQEVWGTGSVPPGCGAWGCGRLPPNVYFGYAYAPFSRPMIELPPDLPPPPVYAPPPPAAYAPPAPPPLGWIWRTLAPCADPTCNTLVVNVAADGANIRTVPGGPVALTLANGVPIIPLGPREGQWILVAASCALAPTYTWSVTAGGLPLSVCL